MASYGHYNQCAARIGSDCIHWNQLPTSVLVLLFQRRPRSRWAKLAQIRSGWPGQVSAKSIWSGSKLVCKKLSRSTSGREKPARYQFPTFRLCCILPQMVRIIILPQMVRIILVKTSPDPMWFWLPVSGFGQTNLVRRQASEKGTSSPFLTYTSKPSQIGCRMDPKCLLGQHNLKALFDSDTHRAPILSASWEVKGPRLDCLVHTSINILRR